MKRPHNSQKQTFVCVCVCVCVCVLKSCKYSDPNLLHSLRSLKWVYNALYWSKKNVQQFDKSFLSSANTAHFIYVFFRLLLNCGRK